MGEPKTITARDKTTGKTVTFRWSGASDPTQADLVRVFQKAGLRGQSAPPTQEPAPLSGIDARPKTVSDYLGRTLENVGPSAINQVAGIPAGLARAPVVASDIMGASGPAAQAQTIGAIGKNIMERYGGADNIANTLMTDPVGFLMDLSTTLSGAGLVAKGVGAANLAGAAERAATLVNPLSAGANLTKAVLPDKLTSPARLMESAVKPVPSLPASTRSRVINTLLDEGIVPSERGLAKVNNTIDDLNNQVSQRINEGAGNGVTVDVRNVASRSNPLVGKTYQQAAESGPSSVENLTDAASRVQKFRQMPIARGQQGQLTADQAQRVKQGIYQDVKYGKNTTHFGDRMDKALAFGIKEELARQIPEIAELNAKESAYLMAQPVVERAVNRIRNTEPVKLGTAVSMAGGEAARSTYVAVANELLNSPAWKARLAIVLHRKGKMGSIGTRVAPFGTINNLTQQ